MTIISFWKHFFSSKKFLSMKYQWAGALTICFGIRIKREGIKVSKTLNRWFTSHPTNTLSPPLPTPTNPNSLTSLLLQSSRVRFFGGLGGGSDLHRDFHSTPDLNVQAAGGGVHVGPASAGLAPKGHRSQEDVNAATAAGGLGRNGLPPPNHPPPPPPVGQVVKVNVGAPAPDVVTPASVYDNMAHIQQVKGEWGEFFFKFFLGILVLGRRLMRVGY